MPKSWQTESGVEARYAFRGVASNRHHRHSESHFGRLTYLVNCYLFCMGSKATFHLRTAGRGRGAARSSWTVWMVFLRVSPCNPSNLQQHTPKQDPHDETRSRKWGRSSNQGAGKRVLAAVLGGAQIPHARSTNPAAGRWFFPFSVSSIQQR